MLLRCEFVDLCSRFFGSSLEAVVSQNLCFCVVQSCGIVCSCLRDGGVASKEIIMSMPVELWTVVALAWVNVIFRLIL